MVTFDGANKRIILPSTGSYNAEIDFYSDWKEWATTGDNLKYLPAFETIGGDDIGSGQEVSPYFFLRTDLGWRIQPPNQDGEILIIGNIFPRTTGVSIMLPADNPYSVTTRISVSAQSLTSREAVFTDAALNQIIQAAIAANQS